MPTYRISDETHERMKRFALPLSDNRDDVVRRVLDIAEGKEVVMGSESLHFHIRNRLAETIETFLTEQGQLPGWEVVMMSPSDIAPRLADHIISTWMDQVRTYTLDKGGEGNADSPDAG